MKKNFLIIHKKNCVYSKKLINFLNKKYDVKTTTTEKQKNLTQLIKNKKFDFIVLFRSHLILKKNFILKHKNVINFHPSIPNYRGVGGVNFAIYNEEKFFGSTVHYIDEKIDNGKIINVRRFKLYKKDDCNKVYKKTLISMLIQAKQILSNINDLNKFIKKAKNEKWSKIVIKRKDLNTFYEINKNISKKNLIKKIKATSTTEFKPYINLYGFKFKLND